MSVECIQSFLPMVEFLDIPGMKERGKQTMKTTPRIVLDNLSI